MRLISRQADRFQRALEGHEVTDEEIARFLESARALTSVRTGAMAPREEFVHALHQRLLAEAAAAPTPSPAAAKAAAERRAAARSKPVVVVVGRGVPKLMAGATASVLAVGGVVAVASQSALPGGTLYPVKGWIDTVQVHMAGSGLDRGRVLLGQAQEHISDARSLADRDTSRPAGFIKALESATESVRGGQRDLNAAFDSTGNPQALLAIRDFATRARPQLEALRPELPAGALPALRELESLLGEAEQASTRKLMACAPACVSPEQIGASPSDLPNLGSPGGSPAVSAPAAPSGGPAASGPGGVVTVPSAPITGAPGGQPPAPGVTAGPGGATIGCDNGGATVGPDGATVNGPTVSVSVPVVPSATVSVSVPLPSVTVGTEGIGVTPPTAGVGGVTAPGVTVTVPGLP
jgi:hypothetical protein